MPPIRPGKMRRRFWESSTLKHMILPRTPERQRKARSKMDLPSCLSTCITNNSPRPVRPRPNFSRSYGLRSATPRSESYRAEQPHVGRSPPSYSRSFCSTERSGAGATLFVQRRSASSSINLTAKLTASWTAICAGFGRGPAVPLLAKDGASWALPFLSTPHNRTNPNPRSRYDRTVS
jgi:hypothetical protein